jgi:hypothetical protein
MILSTRLSRLKNQAEAFFTSIRNYPGSREEVQLLADKSFGQPEKKLNFWLSSYVNSLSG